MDRFLASEQEWDNCIFCCKTQAPCCSTGYDDKMFIDVSICLLMCIYCIYILSSIVVSLLNPSSLLQRHETDRLPGCSKRADRKMRAMGLVPVF